MPFNAKKRIAVIDYDKCHPDKCGGWYCESVCPVNRAGIECIIHEDENQPNIIEETCIGCLICVNKCPFGAISIVNLSIDPGLVLHQFGENLFRLHGYLTPRSGEIIGIVGRNGTGKTTALRILSGQLIPNMGDWKTDADWKNAIEKIPNKETQALFERIEKGEFKVAYKPQLVDQLPKHFNGTVREALQKADTQHQFQSVTETLELQSILERTFNQLSGGELQKVAIAATALREAGVYFLDEPSNFLDIKERVRAARFIQSLANPDTSVLVVEHDLILLDYLTDKVHLMYGTPAVFGMLSQIKNSREGLNQYLEGFSREENYRFRDHGLTFSGRTHSTARNPKELAQFPAMHKTLGEFHFETKGGKLYENEVIGIVGANGIGKTTFVKLLAGVLTPDEGPIQNQLSVSYKPQYLTVPATNASVEELLHREAQGRETQTLDTQIWTPLDLRPLFQKEVQTLSGGELQRLAIALSLSKESPLVLLDEPSAFLDIEQRLKTAKIIRSIAEQAHQTVLVVDHDLVFMDAISDRLMVFSGTPAKHGVATGPFEMEDGMNRLLAELQITVRREPTTQRPRINKTGSQLDEEQKKSGKYYYS